MEAIEEVVNSSNKDQAQIIIKGKRTKRQRLPSPPRLPAMPAASSRTSADNNSGGSFDHIPATSTTASVELRDSTEEEDMANCLILLAQGHTRKRAASPDNNNKSGTGGLIYECKTCNRCFHSFQALGGHRASHKKPKTNAEENKRQAVTYLNEENDHSYHDSTSTDLSLQISNRSALSNANTHSKSKVHECAICGAEFSSGQALGGHMRRHRTITASASAAGNGSAESREVKKPSNVLKLDLNLPAPEDDHSRETKFPFHQSKEKAIVFSATSLVDCHY